MIEEPSGWDVPTQVLEQYKAGMQDLAHIGVRHETARSFYLSVVSALLVFLSLAGKDGPLGSVGRTLFVLVGIGAVAICCLWLIHTLSFTALFSAKIGRLGKMETQLPFQNFREELEILKSDARYVRLTYVECWVAVVFMAIFIVAMLLRLTQP